MIYKLTVIVSSMLIMSSQTFAFDLKGLEGKLKELGNKASQKNTSGSSKQKLDGFNAACEGVLGGKYKKFKTDTANISEYFKVGEGFDATLVEQINDYRQGTMTSFKFHLADIYKKDVRALGNAFRRDPSQANLAQIIEYTKKADNFSESTMGREAPSSRGEANVLLAMVMMQYPSLIKDPGMVVQLLKKPAMKYSNLANLFLARAHLMGDYAEKNIKIFSSYFMKTGVSRKYTLKSYGPTLDYAYTNYDLPNKNVYQQVMDLNASYKRTKQLQQQAVRGSELGNRTAELIGKGNEILKTTGDALGNGSVIAERMAKAKLVSKTAAGEDNIVEIAMTQSQAGKEAVDELLQTKPKLSADSKKKFGEANQKLLDNLVDFRKLQMDAIINAFSQDSMAIALSGTINEYFKMTCDLGFAQEKFAKDSGVPAPVVSSAQELADKNF